MTICVALLTRQQLDSLQERRTQQWRPFGRTGRGLEERQPQGPQRQQEEQARQQSSAGERVQGRALQRGR